MDQCYGLSFHSMQSFGPQDSGIFIIPDRSVRALLISLWGAGGGGGGCAAPDPAEAFPGQAGSGGGGGGYVEAWIHNPFPRYNYFVATGGSGGIGNSTGKSPKLSWFSDPAHVFATGGGGGAMLAEMSTDININVAAGGAGGSGGGSLANLVIDGGQGGQALCSRPMRYTFTVNFALGGNGGAAGKKSGAAQGACIAGEAGSRNGVMGLDYGGGGSGATSLGGLAANGGNGANGHLIITMFK